MASVSFNRTSTLPKPQAAPLRVAMADDDSADQALMAMAATEAELHADFTFYDGGQELLNGLRNAADPQQLPEVIILDLRMPGLDGYETLDQLQGDPILWSIPVVLLTSSERPAEKSLSLERGACLFRQKPADFMQLVSLARGLPLLAISWTGATTQP